MASTEEEEPLLNGFRSTKSAAITSIAASMDELATTSISNHSNGTENESMSKRVNRKLDTALLPFLSLLYLFNGLDRSNVGNAETQGTVKHLLLIINGDHNHPCRIHFRYRRYPGRSEYGRVMFFHHLCLVAASIGCRGKMAWSKALDRDHHGKLRRSASK
jgi:hypothetical protein